MKNFYLLSLLLFLGKITFAQTIPFGFHNPKVFLIEKLTEKINGAKKPTDKNSQIDSTKSPESSKSKKKYSNYDELADSLDAKASTLETNANNVYNTGMDALSKSTPADQGGLTIMNDKIKSLNDARSTAMTTVKTFRKAAEGYRYLARADKGFTLFVVHNAVDAQIYYNGMISDSKAKFLSNSLLSFGTDGGKASLFNELYADYFGPLRFSFGALISSKQQVPSNSDTTKGTQQDAVQRLLGGGGNGVFSLSYPIINAQSSDALFFKLIAAPKLGIDIPKIGTENNSYANNYNLGVEGSLFYTGENGIITVFSNFRFSNISGNANFYDNLNKSDHKAFACHQVSLGVAINSTFRISWNKYFGSSFVNKNFPQTISFTVIPN